MNILNFHIDSSLEDAIKRFVSLPSGGLILFHGHTLTGKTFKAKELFPYIPFLFEDSDVKNIEQNKKALLHIPNEKEHIIIVDEVNYVSKRSIRDLINNAIKFNCKILLISQELNRIKECIDIYGQSLRILSVKFELMNGLRSASIYQIT